MERPAYFYNICGFQKAYDMIPRSHLWYKLLKTDINGNIFKGIQALYNNVKCSVKIIDCFTESMEVTSGLNALFTYWRFWSRLPANPFFVVIHGHS